MSSTAGDQRNWIERLSSKIPGYDGYVDRERRRDTDKLHRERLADRVRTLKAPVLEAVAELTAGGRLFEAGPLDHLNKKLDRIENRIRFASYGYSGFFDVTKIEGPELDAIYESDLALVEFVDNAERAVGELKTAAGSAEALKTAEGVVDKSLDELEKAFENRFKAINDYSAHQPPRPLFG